MNLLRRWWGGVAISIIRPFPVLLRSWTATFSSRWTLVRLPRKRNYLRCSLGIFGISRIEEMTLDGYLLGIECFLGDKLTLSETSKSFVASPSLCIAFQFYIHLKAKRSSNEISPSEALKLWCLQNMDGVGFQEFLYPCRVYDFFTRVFDRFSKTRSKNCSPQRNTMTSPECTLKNPRRIAETMFVYRGSSQHRHSHERRQEGQKKRRGPRSVPYKKTRLMYFVNALSRAFPDRCVEGSTDLIQNLGTRLGTCSSALVKTEEHIPVHPCWNT